MLMKLNKDGTFLQNYWAISLPSAIGRMQELIILRRLGFRNEHSTKQQAATTHGIRNYNPNGFCFILKMLLEYVGFC